MKRQREGGQPDALQGCQADHIGEKPRIVTPTIGFTLVDVTAFLFVKENIFF